MGLKNESPNNHVWRTIEEIRLNRGKTCRDMGGSSKLCAESPKLAMKTFSSWTFLYWLCNSYPQQRGEMNETQARNGSKLWIIGIIINNGPENQLVYSQSQITQEIYYNRPMLDMDMLELDIHQCQTGKSPSSRLEASFARDGDWTRMFEV